MGGIKMKVPSENIFLLFLSLHSSCDTGGTFTLFAYLCLSDGAGVDAALH